MQTLLQASEIAEDTQSWKNGQHRNNSLQQYAREHLKALLGLAEAQFKYRNSSAM